MQLEGRKIVVMGAASGIGFAIADLFLAEGAAVVMIDRSSFAEQAGMAKASRYQCDVTDPDAVMSTIGAIAEDFDGIDGLVNAAGMHLMEPLGSMTLEQWENVMRVNLTAPMLLCRAALPHFKGPGSIVNIASGDAHQPLNNSTAYCAAKAGLVMFTKSLALEIAPRNIRANSVSPGVIDTPMLKAACESAPDPEAALLEVTSRSALKRIGQTEDIARGALYLMNASTSSVTGTTLVIDGGRVFH